MLHLLHVLLCCRLPREFETGGIQPTKILKLGAKHLKACHLPISLKERQHWMDMSCFPGRMVTQQQPSGKPCNREARAR